MSLYLWYQIGVNEGGNLYWSLGGVYTEPDAPTARAKQYEKWTSPHGRVNQAVVKSQEGIVPENELISYTDRNESPLKALERVGEIVYWSEICSAQVESSTEQLTPYTMVCQLCLGHKDKHRDQNGFIFEVSQ